MPGGEKGRMKKGETGWVRGGHQGRQWYFCRRFERELHEGALFHLKAEESVYMHV